MQSYRTLAAWQLAHEAAYLTLKACDDAYHARSRSVFDQLKRAAVSVEANLVEGYALGTPGLVNQHCRIAFGSAAEAECLVRLAGRRGYLDGAIVETLEAMYGDTMRALRGILRFPASIASPSRRPTHNARRTTHVKKP